jgi:hypothetical protein
MDGNVLIVAGIAVAVILIAVRLFSGRRPKEQSFRCSRCSTASLHSARTIEAWRRGKTKFFCNSCHGEWLRNRPRDSSPVRNARAGCLSVVVLVVAIPAMAVVAFLSR